MIQLISIDSTGDADNGDTGAVIDNIHRLQTTCRSKAGHQSAEQVAAHAQLATQHEAAGLACMWFVDATATMRVAALSLLTLLSTALVTAPPRPCRQELPLLQSHSPQLPPRCA